MEKTSALQITQIPTWDHLLSSCETRFLFHQIHTLSNQKAYLFLTECTKFQTWKRAVKSICSYASQSNCDIFFNFFFFVPICLKKQKNQASAWEYFSPFLDEDNSTVKHSRVLRQHNAALWVLRLKKKTTSYFQ